MGACYADGFEIGFVAVGEVAGVCSDRGAYPRARYRGHDRDLYAGPCCAIEVAAGYQAGIALPDWRQGTLLHVGRLHAMGGVLAHFLRALSAISRSYPGVCRSRGF